MLLQRTQSHRHMCCFAALPSSCSPASWRAAGSTWADLQQTYTLGSAARNLVLGLQKELRGDAGSLRTGHRFSSRAGAAWRGAHREGSWASSVADSQAKFFSLALGWRCLKSLCRQAVVPAESKCQPYLLGCPCAAYACPIAHHCGRVWAKPSSERDPISLWEKDCITTGSNYLIAPFPSAHMILLALCYYDVYSLLFFLLFFF